MYVGVAAGSAELGRPISPASRVRRAAPDRAHVADAGQYLPYLADAMLKSKLITSSLRGVLMGNGAVANIRTH